MATQNKNAATDDAVGYLHKAVTKAFSIKMDKILEMIEDEPELALTLVDGRDMSAIMKWIDQNGITCAPTDMQEAKGLKDTLQKLKEKSKGHVIQFVKEG